MFCGECGKSVPNNAVVCDGCGARLLEGAPVEAPRLPKQQNQTPRSWVIPITRTVLESINEGSVIRSVGTWALRVLGILAALGGLFGVIRILQFAFTQGIPAQVTLGALILAVLSVTAVFAVIQVLFFRAESIRDLGPSPFTVTPIISILFRAVGEVYAVFGVILGIGGALFMWLSGSNPAQLLREAAPLFPFAGEAGNSFLDGLTFLALSAVGSFAVLVLFYFLAEMTVVAVDIASNVRRIAKGSDAVSVSRAAAAD